MPASTNWDNKGLQENAMALLQISEPGQTPDPHQRRIAVGIDLGTTHLLVASVRNGVSECLPDDQGRVILPSVVRYLDADRRQIGFEALAAQVEDPHNTISSVKRLMGRGIDDIGNRAQLPYQLNDKPGMVTLQTIAGEKARSKSALKSWPRYVTEPKTLLVMIFMAR